MYSTNKEAECLENMVWLKLETDVNYRHNHRLEYYKTVFMLRSKWHSFMIKKKKKKNQNDTDKVPVVYNSLLTSLYKSININIGF